MYLSEQKEALKQKQLLAIVPEAYSRIPDAYKDKIESKNNAEILEHPALPTSQVGTYFFVI